MNCEYWILCLCWNIEENTHNRRKTKVIPSEKGLPSEQPKTHWKILFPPQLIKNKSDWNNRNELLLHVYTKAEKSCHSVAQGNRVDMGMNRNSSTQTQKHVPVVSSMRCGMSSRYANTSMNVHNTLYRVYTYLHREWGFQSNSLTGTSSGNSDMFRHERRAKCETTRDLFTWGPEVTHVSDNDGTCWDKEQTSQESDHLPLGNREI